MKTINEKQPFGVVIKHNTMGTGLNGKGTVNHLAPSDIVHNNGYSVAISNADKSPRAHEYACRYSDNPFHWSGMAPKRSKGNGYDPRMHISEAPE